MELKPRQKLKRKPKPFDEALFVCVCVCVKFSTNFYCSKNEKSGKYSIFVAESWNKFDCRDDIACLFSEVICIPNECVFYFIISTSTPVIAIKCKI